VDIYPDGMNTEHPALRSQPTVTLQWTSPLSITQNTLDGSTSEVLLYSTENAWIKPDTDILPNYELYPETGFSPGSSYQQYPLAAAVQGSFESFYKGKPSPLIAAPTAETEAAEADLTASAASLAPVIEQSAGSARLVVVGGAAFMDDFVLQLSSRLSQDRLLNNLLFVQNLVDWSVEDLDLLNIRSRGTYTRVLQPMEATQQTTWEAANYVVAVLIPLGIYLYWRQRRLNEVPMELLPVAGAAASFPQDRPKKSETNPEAEA
jgi:ABC-2 type transport system permease protein